MQSQRRAFGDDEVHVWRSSIDLPRDAYDRLLAGLSADELESADRFCFDVDRRRRVIGRGLTRVLIGQLVGERPDALCFAVEPRGKPRLVTPEDGLSPQFNVSHSGQFILVALSGSRALGVDVEQIRPDLDTEAIAERTFSSSECAALASLDGIARRDAFFACWTRKEAVLKAEGVGLAKALDSFDVSLLSGEPARLLATRSEDVARDRWILSDVVVGSGYKAALAVEGDGWALRYFDWPADANAYVGIGTG